MDRVKSSLQTELQWQTRVNLFISIVSLSSLYLYGILRWTTTRQPYFRLLLTSPVLLVNAWLPLLFDTYDELLTRGTITYLAAWMCTFKVLALCMHRGPLVHARSCLQALVLYLLPIYPRQVLPGKAGRLTDTASSSRRLWLAARSLALLCTSVYLITAVGLPDVPRHFAYAFAILGFVTLLMDLPAAVLSGPLGLELIPSFDEPWLSESLADFWGRRWNIPTAAMLRCVVYDPVMEGRLTCAEGGAQGRHAGASGARRAAALAAAFFASGVMHEVIFLYISPVGATFKWLAFFAVQAPLMLVERWCASMAERHCIKVPRLAAIAATLAVLEATAYLGFFPPGESDTDLAIRFAAAVHRNVQLAVASS